MSEVKLSQGEQRLDRSVRVFLDELPWDIRSHNTDWRYVRFSLPKLAHYESSLVFTMQSSKWLTTRENWNVLRDAVGRRLGLVSRREKLISTLSRSDLAASKADVVFAHRAFPVNAGSTPLIWQNSILDPEMQRSYGATHEDVEAETKAKGALYRRAAAVQVSTHAEAIRLGRTFPDIAERFAGIPFFTPHVAACEVSALQRQWEPGPVRVLFVGNQAWRKGLDLLLEAFLALPESVRRNAELTVISNFVPPAVTVPEHAQIRVLRGADASRVMQEMARAHIFVNVARFESYGLVFHEAMSQGLACLAPDWEVQRELFDGGAAGRLLPCSAQAIAGALDQLIQSPEERYRLGHAAWERFAKLYAPAVVARKYAQLFEKVCQR